MFNTIFGSYFLIKFLHILRHCVYFCLRISSFSIKVFRICALFISFRSSHIIPVFLHHSAPLITFRLVHINPLLSYHFVSPFSTICSSQTSIFLSVHSISYRKERFVPIRTFRFHKNIPPHSNLDFHQNHIIKQAIISD